MAAIYVKYASEDNVQELIENANKLMPAYELVFWKALL